MSRFEVLAGLPGNGPVPEYFGRTESGRFREGFIVRFFGTGNDPWLGNFEPGYTAFNDVIEFSPMSPILVIAGGQGYAIDCERRCSVRTFGGGIDATVRAPEVGAVIVSNGNELEAIGETGTIWTSPRVAWDGIRGLQKTESRIVGEAYDPNRDVWRPFAVDVRTGKVVRDGSGFFRLRH